MTSHRHRAPHLEKVVDQIVPGDLVCDGKNLYRMVISVVRVDNGHGAHKFEILWLALGERPRQPSLLYADVYPPTSRFAVFQHGDAPRVP